MLGKIFFNQKVLKMYAVNTHLKCFSGVILISNNQICFNGEIKENIIYIS